MPPPKTMPTSDDALELLRRTLSALEPWPGQFIVVGGWAMQLYRYLDRADSTVMVHHTKDVDIAVDSVAKFSKEVGMRLSEAKLVAVHSRATQPATTTYQLQERGEYDRAPEYVEFLTPLRGRDQREAIEIAPGVGAQTLRYLDLSFAQVRSVDASRVPFLRDLGGLNVRVPSPASYLLAKALVYERRKHDEKRDGDCAYIYWLARMTRALWPEVREDLDALQVSHKWRDRGYRRLRDLFEAPSSDGVVRAVRSIADPDHDAVVVHAVVGRFLEAIGVAD